MSVGRLSGRIAVVTGASRGLGKAIACALAEEGARVALVGRDEERLRDAVSEIGAHGGQARAFLADVSSEDQVERLAREVSEALGPVGILVNNAGINIRKNVMDFTLDEWNRVLNTNLTSAFLMCRAFVPHMMGRGYGRILNMSSTMSHVSLPGRAAYSASKAALLGLTRALALELAKEKITVVAMSPGPFATEMNTPLLENPELGQQFLSRIPIGRWGDVADVGKLAAFLCSDDASFITGTDILIDGGWCAQ